MNSKITLETNLETIIIPIVKEILKLNNVTLEENLKKIGLDSLNTVNLILAIEESLHIELEDEDLEPENFENINAVINLLKRKLA